MTRPPDETGATTPEDRGFALLLVLWSLVLLSLIIGQLLTAGRRETQLAGNLRQAAMAETAADAAIQDTIFHLMTRGGGPPPAPVQMVKLRGGVVRVQLRNIAGMVNPNMAPAPLLTALLQECGASPRLAARLTQAITDWRSPSDDPRAIIAAYRAAGLSYAPGGQAFQTNDEIRLVLGMTPPIADCLVPHLSVFGDLQVPALIFADPVVMRALLRMMRDSGEAVSNAPTPQGGMAVEIIAESRSGTARFVRDATVRFSDTDVAHPYRILTWSRGD